MTHINLGAFKINVLDKKSIPGLIEQTIASNEPTQIITLNSLMFNIALRDKGLDNVISKAGIVLADSVGVILAARFLNGKAIPRITGIELVTDLCRLARDKNWPVYFLGSKEGIASEASTNLKDLFKGLKVAGTRNGYFTKEEENSIIKDISKAGPKILFVGLSSPFQEKWIYSNLKRLGVPVAIGVGGSFDVLSGRLKRAPGFMQKMGIEWLFRLIQEPSRITRMAGLPVFVWNIIKLKYVGHG